MPKKTATVEATEPKISLTMVELQALVASEVAKQSVQSTSPNSDRLAEALDAINANQKAIVQQANERHRTLADMLKDDPKISAYNPRGDRDYPRPTHFRKVNGTPRRVYFCGIEQSSYLDRMKADEIAGFDSFTENCECRNKTWKAKVWQDGSVEVLSIELPTGDIDKKQEIGAIGLTNILYELRTQGKIRPDVTTALNKLMAEAVDPDAFLMNLKTLLSQPVAA